MRRAGLPPSLKLIPGNLRGRRPMSRIIPARLSGQQLLKGLEVGGEGPWVVPGGVLQILVQPVDRLPDGAVGTGLSVASERAVERIHGQSRLLGDPVAREGQTVRLGDDRAKQRAGTLGA